MAVVLYSARPGQRARQLVVDAVLVAGLVVAVVVGVLIARAIGGLAAIGTRVSDQGSAFQQQLGKAAAALGELPFAGDAVSRPLRQAAAHAGAVADAGTQQHDDTLRLAHLVGGGTTVLLGVVLLLTWALLRGPFVRTATIVRRIERGPAGTELLAVRTLVTNPDAAHLGADVVERWRRGDLATVQALADLERRRNGLPSRPS